MPNDDNSRDANLKQSKSLAASTFTSSPISDTTTPVERFTAIPIRLRNVRLQAGKRILLENADADIPPGELTVIVGASGAGKSTLLKILARLVDRHDTSIQFSGEIAIGDRLNGGNVGIVFQQFALMDELSAKENVALAVDHRRNRSAGHHETAEQWLAKLAVPTNVPVTRLSGGQKQRLAIARTLAGHPDVVLYDEPTSGLDASTADRVAQLIQKTQQSFGVTSVVVTHDYASWLPVADRVLLFDPNARQLRLVSSRDRAELMSMLHSDNQDSAPSVSPATTENSLKKHTTVLDSESLLGRLGDRVIRFFSRTTDVVQAIATLPIHLVPIFRSPKWGARFGLHYFYLVAGPSAWVYLAVAGLIVGFVSTYFTFRFLPYAVYTKPLLIEDLLGSIGFALYRVLVPILAAVLIAARCGAAVAADVAGKRYGSQTDALQSLGVAPQRYLLTSILYAFLLGTPLLTWLAFMISRWTSLAVYTAMSDSRGPYFWNLHFHDRLLISGHWWYEGLGWWMIKALLCGLGIGLIAYYQGMRPKISSRDVSSAITSTVLWATLYVLVVHFIIAFSEFTPG